jgi:hypothetical protein
MQLSQARLLTCMWLQRQHGVETLYTNALMINNRASCLFLALTESHALQSSQQGVLAVPNAGELDATGQTLALCHASSQSTATFVDRCRVTRRQCS